MDQDELFRLAKKARVAENSRKYRERQKFLQCGFPILSTKQNGVWLVLPFNPAPHILYVR